VGVVERLIPPASGSGATNLDTSFNPSGTTPGTVTIATPNGNNSPTLYGCSVVDEAGGIAVRSSWGAWTAARRPAWCWRRRSAASAATTPCSAEFPDVILSGFSFTKGTNAGSAAKASAMPLA
jgi:hypothetical protein